MKQTYYLSEVEGEKITAYENTDNRIFIEIVDNKPYRNLSFVVLNKEDAIEFANDILNECEK